MSYTNDGISSSQKIDQASDSDDDSSHAPTLTDKHRQQNALFNSWCLNEGGTNLRAANEAKKRRGQAEDDQVTIKKLLAKQEPTVIIRDPREYQLELYERAKNQNTIAVLDTGSGKTLIAVLLLRHVVDQELERRANGHAPRVAFFLVPKVNLVLQQAVVLERNLGCTITQIHGSMNVDAWSESYWAKLLAGTQIVVCTADILLHSLARSFVHMSSINLLVFDEVHHAKLGHPYSKLVASQPRSADTDKVRIMHGHYFTSEKGNRPKLFSMTASPVDANVDVLDAALYIHHRILDRP